MKEYLITTHDDTDQKSYKKFLLDLGVEIHTDYEAFPTIYKVAINSEQLTKIKNNKETKEVEPANTPVNKLGRTIDETGKKIVFGEKKKEIRMLSTGEQIIDNDDNWGLGRIDERDLADTRTYFYEKTGLGVDVYVVDTGIFEHNDIAGRVTHLFTAYDDFIDRDGHGTHVASTVGGKIYGVAKNVELFSVKVFDTGGASVSIIVDGANEALKHHNRKISNGENRPSVVNMSLGGNGSMLGTIATEMKKAGMIVCAAAGNESGDLDNDINVWPAESPDVITVNSLTDTDGISLFNNYGSACDIFAPGEDIKAAGISGSNSWAQMSGTSMATPHVAGVVALSLEGIENMPKTKADAESVINHVISTSTKGKVNFEGFWSDKKDRLKNKIVYSLLDQAPPPPREVPDDEDDEKNKKQIFIAGGVLVAVAIIFTIVAL